MFLHIENNSSLRLFSGKDLNEQSVFANRKLSSHPSANTTHSFVLLNYGVSSEYTLSAICSNWPLT